MAYIFVEYPKWVGTAPNQKIVNSKQEEEAFLKDNPKQDAPKKAEDWGKK